MAIFIYLEDRNRIINGGLYFFNNVGLYLRDWVERFNPNKEDLSWALVWIRLYSLPLDYWDEASLQYIANGLGEFVKIAEETKLKRYMSYSWICIYMHLNNTRLDAVSLFHDNFEWIQSIHYEHVLLCSRKCHAPGHLFWDFPSNLKTSVPPPSIKSDSDDFTKVSHHKKHLRRSGSNPKTSFDNLPKLSKKNNFDSLAQPYKQPWNP